MDRPTFRQVFAEFASEGDYPNTVVDFWFAQARIQLDAERWADLLDQGLALYTAHKLALARATAKAGAKGVPGGGVLVSSKSIDKLSVGYDTGATTIDGAGNWNATQYGVQFWQLARMVGIGGLQL